MEQNSPIRNLIDTWPTRKALADQIGANADAVHKWASSSRIPSDWQSAVVRAAQDNGMENITAAWMIEQHARLQGAA